MPGAITWGSEILVNTTATNAQFSPAIAGLPDGRFVAVWSDSSRSPDDPWEVAVRAQIFNADGSKSREEFLVNTTTASGQYDPSVTALANGRFVVTWTDLSRSPDDPSETAVRAQIFEVDGAKVGSEFLVPSNTASSQYHPAVAGLADGRFVATWADDSNMGGDLDAGAIHARLFDQAGNPTAGGDLLANSWTEGLQIEPAIAALANGNFVVAWSDWSESGGGDQSGASIRAQVFRADGIPVGSELLINTTTDDSQYDPSVTALADGRFVVAWTDHSESGGDTDGFAVRARIFAADGAPAGNEFLVNSMTGDHQTEPVITALRSGGFVASWLDDSGYPVRALRTQVFDAEGVKSGGELVVATGDFALGYPAITALADGRFVVTWQDNRESGDDTDASSVHAQILDPRDGPVNLVGTSLADDLVGTAFNDTITGKAGSDRLDGGDGDDTAVFSQSRDKYTITDLGDRLVVSGPDGTDVLYNFEHLRFADSAPAPGPGPAPADYVSGLFDTSYYLAHNPDVAAALVGARDHFNAFGWHEGRDPNAFFDTSGYLGANKDVAAAGMNPLDHYHRLGWHEGRDPSAWFDTTLYLVRNPDVAAAGIDPLEHYLQHGMAEGRAIYQAIGEHIVGGFDAEYYLFHNPDVAAAGVDPLQHFNAFGWHEGRNPNAWFDTAGYLSHYGDVAAAGVNPLEHYEQFGWREGRDPSAGFDTLGYLAANGDVAAANVNPLDHFLQFGIYEGRQVVDDGVWH